MLLQNAQSQRAKEEKWLCGVKFLSSQQSKSRASMKARCDRLRPGVVLELVPTTRYCLEIARSNSESRRDIAVVDLQRADPRPNVCGTNPNVPECKVHKN